MILAVIVLRSIESAVRLGEGSRHIQNHGGWRQPLLQCRQVDVGFEAGPRLPFGSGHVYLTVDLVVVVVQRANHGKNLAGVVLNGDDGRIACILVLLLQNPYLFTGYFFRVFLQFNIERRIDGNPFLPDEIGVIRGVEFLVDLIEHIQRKMGRSQDIKALGDRIFHL